MNLKALEEKEIDFIIEQLSSEERLLIVCTNSTKRRLFKSYLPNILNNGGSNINLFKIDVGDFPEVIRGHQYHKAIVVDSVKLTKNMIDIIYMSLRLGNDPTCYIVQNPLEKFQS